ncbi:MAG: type II CAAX endopeptidase family protein [Candidatus Bathyarchaeia archaeon]
MGQVGSESSNLLLFFLIAFAWSWFFWFLQMWGLNLFVAPFGPFVAAFLLTFRNEGKLGVKELFKKGFDPRIGKTWYVPIFLLMPIIAGFSLLLAWLSERTIPELTALSQPWLVLWNFVYIFFLEGPFEEEFGWRGYALPRLQMRHTALVSSIVLGIIWAIWHLPLNFMAQPPGPQYEAAIGMLLGSIVTMTFMSILFTWIYNNTGGSVFAALLFHTMVNLSTYVVFPVFETQTGPLYYLILMIAVAIIILVVFGAKRMAREKKIVFLKPKLECVSHFG